MSPPRVLIGHSLHADTRTAAAELIEAIAQPNAVLTLVFSSPTHDLTVLGPLLDADLSGPVIGCTTAGEDSAFEGHAHSSLVGVSVASPDLMMHPHLINPLHTMTADDAKAAAADLHKQRRLAGGACFALLFIDGMSMLEEVITAYLYDHLRVPLIGGSAADNLTFGQTHVYWQGRFITDAAVVALVETTLPFTPFRSQHIQPTGKRLVVTEADPTARRVMEIDGEVAAVAYAQLLGLGVADLSPAVFSAHPVMLRLGGEYYVRSIQRVEPDGSLVFYCAIDNGIVLSMGKGGDLVGNLRQTLADITSRIGPPVLVFGCDCILRQLEIEQRGIQQQVNDLFAALPYVGFNGYGEQFDGVHVNQTLTGVAIGAPRR